MLIQYPNKYGEIEDFSKLSDYCKKNNLLTIPPRIIILAVARINILRFKEFNLVALSLILII